MVGKLAEIVLSAKSSAVSGVLILAGGALVSASTGAGNTAPEQNDPEPTPIVNAIEPEDELDDEFVFEPETEPEDEPDAETIEVADVDCGDEESARAKARGRIGEAFKNYDSKLDALRADLKGKGSAAVYEALASADAMLAEIRAQAIGALDEMGLCVNESVGQVAFDRSVGALALLEVSDRAIAAMETVYNLARSTVLRELERLKPTPTPKPKKTEKPKATERPKHTKAPRCEDAMYAAKKRLQKAFDQYHGGHDKLMKELKGWAEDRSMRAFWSADQILHQIYDEVREHIIHAGCAAGEKSAMALAESAEVAFKETYAGSKGLYATLIANKPDREACEEAMYAAKKRLQKAFDVWHTANDKLHNGVKSFGSEEAIEVARHADRVIHETYDATKEAIHKAHCTPQGSNAMELAEEAAEIFERVHKAARESVARELASNGGDDKTP